MPESEEDLRQFLRKEVAEQRQAVDRARWRTTNPGLLMPDPERGVIDPRLMTPDPLYGGLELGLLDETPPDPDASYSAPDPSAPTPTGAPPVAAPPPVIAASILPAPKAAVVAAPARLAGSPAKLCAPSPPLAR